MHCSFSSQRQVTSQLLLRARWWKLLCEWILPLLPSCTYSLQQHWSHSCVNLDVYTLTLSILQPLKQQWTVVLRFDSAAAVAVTAAVAVAVAVAAAAVAVGVAAVAVGLVSLAQ